MPGSASCESAKVSCGKSLSHRHTVAMRGLGTIMLGTLSVLAFTAHLGGCGDGTVRGTDGDASASESGSGGGSGGGSDGSTDTSVYDATGSSDGPDGSGAEAGEGGSSSTFGEPCSSSMPCTGLFDECNLVEVETQECTKACNQDSDCPQPPTDGECTPPDLPADAGMVGYCL
jgi:hypothetical protein